MVSTQIMWDSREMSQCSEETMVFTIFVSPETMGLPTNFPGSPTNRPGLGRFPQDGPKLS